MALILRKNIDLAYKWDKVCYQLNPKRGHEVTSVFCPSCHKRKLIVNFTEQGICKLCAKRKGIAV